VFDDVLRHRCLASKCYNDDVAYATPPYAPQPPLAPLPPQPPKKTKKRQRLEIVGLIALVIVAMFVGRSCLGFAADIVARNLPYTVDADLGKSAAASLRESFEEKSGGDDPTPEQVTRVEKIFEDLQKNLTAEEKEVLQNIHVTVVVDDMCNAFALPGGEVFVLTGLLDRVQDDDDQIRGVLAHELGHAVKRHGLRSLARHVAFGVIVALITGGDDFMNLLVGNASMLDQLGHSREMETEADEFGTDLLLRGGHDIEGLARFLDSLGDQPVPELLSTHPDPTERADEIRERAGGGGD
jgi:predicted Zn-dependent protease